ncbi:uncharacterized protein LOC111278272 [Durio zibethinus]|uniref:Uncharacterized protein LOC111278272 n=1 Tax=Durio zibethinus TaxID=66656 RepID=A0A6P5WXM6_DURZI|nr:uncharacterized protein LOC111278272 [Durio zibethinus]XP_022720618.1 uncharacterized protein LOC111278272 [Durio zibethinus]
MADWHGIMANNSGGCSRRSMRDEDFDEEEVWSYEKKEDSSPTLRKSRESSTSSSAWRLPSTPRMIGRVTNSSASHETKLAQQSSAPMNIPDWSKIYGKHANMESSRNGSWVDNRDGMVYDDEDYGGCGEDEDEDIVPPHEWLARKLARSQISSFSVCEGMGRTLKGRDLSKVRNAVLTKTGFLEQMWMLPDAKGIPRKSRIGDEQFVDCDLKIVSVFCPTSYLSICLSFEEPACWH